MRWRNRTVVNLVPGRGHFVASFALSEKGCEAASGSKLSPSVLNIIKQAPRYPEGRGVRLEVRSKKDLASIHKLAAIRMASLR